MSKKELLVKTIKDNNLDLIILSNFYNRFWYTNFSSSEGFVFVSDKKSVLLADGRYIESAQNAFKANNIFNIDEVLLNKTGGKEELIGHFPKLERIGIEADYLTIIELEKLKSWLPHVEFINLVTQKWREVKTLEEIALMQEATKISDLSIANLLKQIKVGMTEKQVAWLLEQEYKKNGADSLSFPSIVAFAENSAKPHASPSDKVLKENDIILIDSGCYKNHYCSDMTRVFFIGNPDKKLLEIYQIVKEAQQKGLDAIKEGLMGKEVDYIVRKHIEEKGYGQYFIHGTGHSLGLEIHENPRLNTIDETVLQENMVITIEPGIYLPGLGGVRIEDDVVVQKNKSYPLNKTSKNLFFIDK